MYLLKIYDYNENNTETFVEEQEGDKLEPLQQRLVFYVQNMINKRMEIFKTEKDKKPVLIVKGRCMERNTPIKHQTERVITIYKK